MFYNCFILYITLLFLFSRDADSRKGTLCPFCVPIHKKKKKKKIFIFIIFVVLRVPLLTFGPPGRFCSRGDARRGE